MNLDQLRADLERDEGVCLTPYKDTVGVMTIGIGHNLQMGISPAVKDLIFEEDIADVVAELDRNAPWWRGLSETRQRALANMAFNLGWPRLSNFKNTLAALEAGDFEKAAVEAMDSKWARQVKGRAERIAKLILEG